jgi:anti-sigma-K factor RskA
MIPVKHIDPDDIALYAMQLLPPDETEEMSLHLQHSAEARRVLAEVYSDLSIFAHSAEMHSPPALARQRLMKHVAREKKVLPPDPLAGYSGSYAPRANVTLFEEEVAKRSVASRVLPWVGWALAAGMAGLSVSLYMQKTDAARNLLTAQNAAAQTEVKAEAAATVVDTLKDPTALHFLLTATDKPVPPQGRVTYLQEKGALVLTASNLDKLPPYKIYELWLIPMDGHDPIPAGTFHPDARGFATVVMPELPKGVSAKMFAVTVEDGEGGPVPTSPVVLKGTAG